MAGLFDELEKGNENNEGGLFSQLLDTNQQSQALQARNEAERKRVTERADELEPSKLQKFGTGVTEFVGSALHKLQPKSTSDMYDVPMKGTQELLGIKDDGLSSYEKREKELKELKAQEGFLGPTNLGSAAGEMAKFGLTYAAGGSAVEKAVSPLTGKIASSLARKAPEYALSEAGLGARALRTASKVIPILTAEGAKDLVLGTPLDYQEAKRQGLKGQELASYMGEQAVYNMIGNAVMLGGESLLKSRALKKATAKQVDDIAENIVKETELPENVVKQNINKIVAENKAVISEKPTTNTIAKETEQIVPQVEFEGIEPKPTKIMPALESKSKIDVDNYATKRDIKESKFNETAIKSDATETELKKMIKKNPAKYQPTSEVERIKVAKQIIDESESAAIAMVKNGDRFASDIESAIGLELVPKLQNEGKFDEALEIIQAIGRKGSKAGQFVQQMAAWSKSTPEGMLKWADKTLSKEGIKLDKTTADNVTKLMKSVNEVDIDSMKKNLSNLNLKTKVIDTMQLDRLKALNVALAQKQVSDLMPVSLARKISTYQAISHLLNGKTMLRNIFGNTSFALAENLSKVYGTGFDKLLSLKTGKRTSALPKFIEPFKEGVKRFKESGQEIKLGVELGQGKYDLFRGKTFKKGVLSKLEDALSRGLRQPDEAFKGFIETQSLYSQLKPQLGDKVNQMTADELVKVASKSQLKQAQQEALYATFQDNSLPAQVLQATKDVANKIGIGKKFVGPSGTKTREFGVGDFIIKYTKVPGNIISRGVEYTPAGYLKGLSLMNKAFKTNDKALQREAANAFGRATNGTSMIALSTWLANKGLIVGEDKDRSYDAKALDRAEGLGNYRLNVSAIDRMIKGEDTSIKNGDDLVSYNWNQPVATSLALGASLDEQLKKEGIKTSLLGKIMGRATEEILDLPTLFIIKQMFFEGLKSESTPMDIAAVPLTQGLSGFVPGPVRQTTRMIDPTYRETKGKTQFETAGKKVLSSIPFASKKLEPRLSPLGEEIKAKTGVLETYINPGNASVYKTHKITPILKKVEDLTGKQTIYPNAKAPNSVTENKIKIELTPKEKVEYQKKFGEELNKNYSRLMPKIGNIDNLSEKQLVSLADKLEKIKKDARNKAKFDLLRRRKNETN